MAEKVSIFVEGAPQAFGHFSQVIKIHDTVYTSGILPIDVKTNRLVSDDAGEQAKAVLQHLTALMQACSGQLSNIVTTRVYFVDLRDHSAYDKVCREFFFFTPPARTVIPVPSLPFGAKIMLEAVGELNPVEVKGGRLL